MIPLLALVSFRNKRNRGFRLWIPLFLVWLLLLPLFFVVCAVGEVNALQALATFGQILKGLKGARIEVAERQASVLVHTF